MAQKAVRRYDARGIRTFAIEGGGDWGTPVVAAARAELHRRDIAERAEFHDLAEKREVNRKKFDKALEQEHQDFQRKLLREQNKAAEKWSAPQLKTAKASMWAAVFSAVAAVGLLIVTALNWLSAPAAPPVLPTVQRKHCGGEASHGLLLFDWQVFDAKVVHLLRDEYRVKQVTKVSADTLEDLAGKLEGVDPKQFPEEIAAYNAAVNTDTPFNPNVKDGRRTQGLAVPKSKWANTLDAPPFEAYQIGCGLTFTFGGLRIAPTTGQVIDTDLEPIPGLYAAGELVGGIFNFNYPGGTGLLSGAVFGRQAGRAAGEAANKRNGHALSPVECPLLAEAVEKLFLGVRDASLIREGEAQRTNDSCCVAP